MVQLNGEELDLKDLFGYTKLQDLLIKLINQIASQEGQLAQFSDRLESELEKQAALIDQVRADAEDCSQQVKDQLEAANAEQAAIRELAASLDARCQNLESNSTSQDLIEQLQKNLVNVTAEVESHGEKHKALHASHEEKVTSHARSLDLLGSRLDSFASVNDNLEELNNRMALVNEDLEKKTVVLTSHEESIAVLNTAMESTQTSVQVVREDFTGADSKLEERLAALNSTVDAGFAEIKAKPDVEALEQLVKRLEAEIKQLHSKMSSDHTKQLIDALADKEASDVTRLTREVNSLQGQMGSFLDKGSSATARCLSCFDRKAQLHNAIVLGSDGKTYLKSRGGASLGRLDVASPPPQGRAMTLGRVNAPSPPRTASPLRSRMMMAPSMSGTL